MSYRTHCSPPGSLCSSYTGLLAVPQIFQALSRLGAFTLVLPFAWNASVPHLPQRNSKGTSLFKMESIHPLIIPFSFPLCISSLALITIGQTIILH